ncbi:MAG: DUF202 domain-containing protein [Candidatus Aminicenantes bacterium]|nr:DUF202 domain-containing protein [Candidatus Aminicenantes bacterium]
MNMDELAIIRTNLANERTFLAYMRTALAFLAAGAGMIHFFQSPIIHSAGWFLFGAGITILVFGNVRFIIIKRRISQAYE